MRNTTLFFIQRPILVNFLLAINFVLGGYFLYKVPKEAFPAVSTNQVLIVTKYPGASARDIELNITSKIEAKVDEIGNIKEYRSSSIEGVSRVTVIADDNLNSEQFQSVLLDIEGALDRIDDFPTDMEGRPVITSVTTEDRPILEIAFTGNYDRLVQSIPKTVQDIRKISGVSTITLVGLPEQEIHIEVDAKKALENKIDLNTIFSAIKARNQVGTGGTLESFLSQKKIVSFNKYDSAEDILNTILRMSPEGYGVYLKDVASIKYQPKEDNLIVRNNGQRGATMLIAIRSGIDQLKVADQIKKYLQTLKLPSNVDYRINNDVSDTARSKFALLRSNGLIGFVLVVALLFYFLGGQSAFWTAFGIPFTVIGSMILFVPLGMTLNSVSLGAFVIVLGMIVDDAMVISERFDRNLRRGLPPDEAASLAVERLWKPVLAASLTTVTAFMPLLSLGGLPGKFVWQMPAVVMIALFISLVDCYFLLPCHLAHGKKTHRVPSSSRLMEQVESLYESVLSTFLNHRYLAVVGFVSLLAISFFIGMTKIRKDSFPQEAAQGFTIQATLKEGYGPEKVEGVVAEIEKSLNQLKDNELDGYTARLGTHSVNTLTDYGTEENLVAFLVYLTPYSERERTALGIVSELKAKLLDSFRRRNYELKFDLMRVGPPLGEPFEIIISSNDDERREKAKGAVESFLSKIDGVFAVKDDLIAGKEEINLKLDYQQVAEAGLTPSDIIRTLRIAFDGQVVTEYTSVNQSYDFRLRLDETSRSDFNFVSRLPIANKLGQMIHLDTMIDYEALSALAEIKHYNGVRSTSITGNIDPQKLTAVEVLNIFTERFKKDENVKYTLSGRPVEEAKIFSGLKSSALLAVLGIYLILSLIFNSYAIPFLVLAVIPFCIVGVFWAFFTHGVSLSMFAGIGLIGLAGIIVNDSIVFVDHVRKLAQDSGGLTKDILLNGAKDRLRPISLTTLSTALAVAPTAYAWGGYDPLLSPLSLAVLYGLLFGTTVVLLFLPCLYLTAEDIRNKVTKRA